MTPNPFRLILIGIGFLVAGIFVVGEGEQTCSAEGVCFADDDAMGKYYYAGVKVPIDFGDDQQVAGEEWKQSLAHVVKARSYMEMVRANETMRSVRDDCLCRNELCSFWAAIGECEKNPDYMLLQCAPSCQTCHELDFSYRCPWNREDAPSDAWKPGSLNAMFERITTEEYYVERYSPTILSRPPEGPWVITLDNVASEEECQRMIDLGTDLGYQRSMDVGDKKFDGTYGAVESSQRTSSNAWCADNCYNDTLHQAVLARVENFTGIPELNSEYWQLLRYEESQFYGYHHDYIAAHYDRAQGVRILTVFLYLNEPEEGGGTHFKHLDITSQPKTGRALIWPSVMDKGPNRIDPRTHHEALPVVKGVKYGANAWIHQRDFKTPYQQKCT